jgi:hypothetical protein
VVSFIEEKAESKSVVEGDEWRAFEILLSVNSPGDEIKGKVAGGVARYLGPIHRLWAAGPWTRCCWSEGLSDRAKVSPLAAALLLSPLNLEVVGAGLTGSLCCQVLPLGVLELALKSEELQLASENDAYALVGGWVASGPAAERECEFNLLVKCLRLHHMSPAFLTSVVSRSEFRDDCPYLSEACANAFMYQSIVSTLSSQKVSLSDEYMASCKPRRSPAAVEYEFEAQVQLAECLTIDEREPPSLDTRLGVVE